MRSPSAYALTATLALASVSCAQTTAATASGSYPTEIIGTWTTKSNNTLTGPAFYDPAGDKLIEPQHTGISYSFTDDGYYEEAYYRAISNPQNPSCPSGIMQWQHGSYTWDPSTGKLQLTPIAVDGRQLLSAPCDYKKSIYTRYNQSETFKTYQQYTDPYHGIPRLDLHKFDNSIMQPMYLVYRPPQMLPTTTLKPTPTGTQTAKPSGKSKRGLESSGREVPLNYKMSRKVAHEAMNPDRWWWAGLTMTGLGGLLYFGPRRMGIVV